MPLSYQLDNFTDIGVIWTTNWSASDIGWQKVAWSPSLAKFAAIANTDTNRVMTSTNGTIWTLQSAFDYVWENIIWSPDLALYCAVASNSLGVMTSTNGSSWTLRTAAADNAWQGIAWSPALSLFAAVAGSGTGNRVMTSPDGITWTIRTSAADNNWRDICWSAELALFVAVSSTGVLDRVMTSPDGITWTIRSVQNAAAWRAVAWSPALSLFAAVADDVVNVVMTSPDGITWTTRSSSAKAWRDIVWVPELSRFIVIGTTAGAGPQQSMVSADGITWRDVAVSTANDWQGLAWSPSLALFAAVGNTGVNNRAMSGIDGLALEDHTPNIGQGWTAGAAKTLKIVNNEVAGNMGGAYWTQTDATYDEHLVVANLKSGASFWLEVNGRVSATGALGYRARLNSTGVVELWTAGALLGSYTIPGFSQTTYYQIMLVITTPSKGVLVDSVTRITSADEQYAGNKRGGIRFEVDSPGRLDNFNFLRNVIAEPQVDDGMALAGGRLGPKKRLPAGTDGLILGGMRDRQAKALAPGSDALAVGGLGVVIAGPFREEILVSSLMTDTIDVLSTQTDTIQVLSTQTDTIEVVSSLN